MHPPSLELPLSKEAAARLVERYLATLEPVEPDNPWVINPAPTREHEWGWVFFWHNKRFLETKDFNYDVGGNCPVIVNKMDGSLYSTGSGRGIDFYIDLYLKDRSAALSRKDFDFIPNSRSALCTAQVTGLPTPEHGAATRAAWSNANLCFAPRLNTRS
jgi:Immunity protein 35